VGTGHPCIGCTEKGIGFEKPIHALAELKFVTSPAFYPRIVEEQGKGVGVASVAVLAGGVGVAVAPRLPWPRIWATDTNRKTCQMTIRKTNQKTAGLRGMTSCFNRPQRSIATGFKDKPMGLTRRNFLRERRQPVRPAR